MNLVKVRFDGDIRLLLNDDFDIATSPVTRMLQQDPVLVIDTSLEASDLNRFNRIDLYPVPVISILAECCKFAGTSLDTVHWITSIDSPYPNKIMFNGTLEEYNNSRGHDIEFETSASKHFLALNNFPKPHRKAVVDYLESSGINSKAYYSYNPRKMRPGYSVVLDDQFSKGDLLDQLDLVPATIWQDSFISIVAETLFDRHIIFPTEKTWKVFDKYHFPIFVSCPGFVAHIRSLGFDVFDDLFDHSYDDIEDDDKRLQAVFKEIDTWAVQELDVIGNVKSSLRRRLEYNKAMLNHLINSEINKRDEQLRSLR